MSEQWAAKHLKPVSVIDDDYRKKALEYNRANMKKQYFLQDRAEMQACTVAFNHGLMSGAYYGGIAGLGAAIYNRKLRFIPKYALGWGMTYGLLLGSSAWFRFDI
jgi:hypothetical protein